MPRRPSQRAKSHSKPRPVDRNDSKIKRWDTLSDIELDEEDQFHTSRDKILLDEGYVSDEDGDEEEEVFALQGVSSGSDDDFDQAEHPHQTTDDDQGSDSMQVDSDAHSEPTKSKSKPSKAARDTKKSSLTKDASESEEEETWGRSKGAYYSSNAAQLDSDDEEANELEEQEALRLQAMAREAMCDDDFGLGDVVEGDIELPDPEATEQDESPIPPLTKVPQDKQSVIRALEKESPETLALARDWDDTAHNLVETKARIQALKNSESTTLELSFQHMYYQALLTYATTLAFYLHLRATEKYAARPELLRRHPILKRLLMLKEGISTLESIGIRQDVSDDDDDDDDDDGEDEEDDLTDEDAEDGDLWSLVKKKGLELGELAGLLEDAVLPTPSPPSTTTSSKKSDPTKKERLKKKHKTPAVIHGSDHGTNGPVFDLVEPEYTRTSRKKNKLVPVADTVAAADPYGELTALQHHDLSDKQARNKSLRFYVSRIESSSSRRTNARAHAIGGDDDIPYRERKKEREARLEKESERKKGKDNLGAGGDDLDDADPEVSKEEKKRKRKRVKGEDAEEGGDDAIGYYDLVKQVTAAKKARKKAEYEATTTLPELEPESTSGPRSITRAILKNKGLTPRRAKAVRNPRVKKRQKYEEAKKRVASQKPVYRGGIGDVSKYSGEQSGISKVVKSVRL